MIHASARTTNLAFALNDFNVANEISGKLMKRGFRAKQKHRVRPLPSSTISSHVCSFTGKN